MRAARLRTLLPMMRSALFFVIALVVVLTGLSEIGVNIGPLLAGASIFGVALGFGSQKLVQDFITGIFLLMENAMQVGDWVTLAGRVGHRRISVDPHRAPARRRRLAVHRAVQFGVDGEQHQSRHRQCGGDA